MLIFRLIFSIIFAPIRLIANLLTQHKDNILEWHLNYGPSFVKIQTNHKEQFLSDDLLIAGYILFLARYFYICDDRQTNVVQDFLLNEIKESQKPGELAGKLFNTVFQTLSKAEQDATIGLFKSLSFLPVPEYPLTYSENEEPKYSFAKYSFIVFEQNRSFISNFYMSSGPDIILLPLTIGVLYTYVVDKFIIKENKKKLDRLIIELLETHKTVDCRSLDGLRKLPDEIIHKSR